MERLFNIVGRLSVPLIVCSIVFGIGLNPLYFIGLPIGVALLVVTLQHNLSLSLLPLVGGEHAQGESVSDDGSANSVRSLDGDEYT